VNPVDGILKWEKANKMEMFIAKELNCDIGIQDVSSEI